MKKIPQLILLILLGMMGLFGCNSVKYPRPTKEFYVNDFANALSDAVEDTIVGEGERLYDMIVDEEDYGGAQIVFATFLVENTEEIAEYDKTELFRQWRIGKNDMGILVIYFFMTEGEAAVLSEVQIEVGYRMEQYLTPSEAGTILDSTIMVDDDLEIGTAHLLYELLTVVYCDAYDYNSFNYDMETYQEYLDTYVSTDDDISSIPMDWIFYLLSPYSSWASKIFTLLAMLVLVGGVGGGVIRTVGGGGSSGGMGIRRRR